VGEFIGALILRVICPILFLSGGLAVGPVVWLFLKSVACSVFTCLEVIYFGARGGISGRMLGFSYFFVIYLPVPGFFEKRRLA
jgi:hypothetical protein